jgi:HEAT repeat protein
LLASAFVVVLGLFAFRGCTVALLQHDNPTIRSTAAKALGVAGGGLGGPLGRAVALGATPALLDALQDKEAAVRQSAADTLGTLAPTEAVVVGALAAALKDDNALVRQSAAEALKHIGPAAQAAVPALTTALHDPSEPVRTMAAAALGKINK